VQTGSRHEGQFNGQGEATDTMNTILIIVAALIILYGWGAISYYFGFYKKSPL